MSFLLLYFRSPARKQCVRRRVENASEQEVREQAEEGAAFARVGIASRFCRLLAVSMGEEILVTLIADAQLDF